MFAPNNWRQLCFKMQNVCKSNKNHKQPGEYSPCVSQMSNFCCKQVKQTKTSTNYKTNRIFESKSENVIYLLLC